MNIQTFKNFLINTKPNNFQINKYIQNPITFRGTIEADTLELHTISAKNTTDTTFEQEKKEVLEKFEKEISKNNATIAEAMKPKTELDSKKSLAMQMVDDEDFLSQIEDALLTYKEDCAIFNANSQIDSILRKHKLTQAQKEKSLSQIIEKYFPSDIQAVQEQGIPVDIVKLAKEIRKKTKDTEPYSSLVKTIDSTIAEYSKKNSVQVDDIIKLFIIISLVKTKDETTDDFKKHLAEQFDKEIKPFTKKINYAELENASLEYLKQIYLTHFEADPISACYFDPFISMQEKIKKLEDTGCFKQFYYSDYPTRLTEKLTENGVLIPFGDNRTNSFNPLIDLRNEQNKKIADLLIGKEGSLSYLSNLAQLYHVPSDVASKLPIDQINIEYIDKRGKKQKITLVDNSKEETIKLLKQEGEKWARTKVQRSKYAFDAEHPCKEKEIPSSYLVKLGFGTEAIFKKAIETGALKGEIREIQTPEGVKYETFIDSSDKKLRSILTTLREKNKGVTTLKELAKTLGISQKRLLQDIADGKLDLISEYLFIYDNEAKFIDKRTEKNRTYIETTLFEQEVLRKLKEEEQQQQRESIKQKRIENKDALSRFQSLRMSLVWHFCPNTRNIGSTLAVKDGHLCKLLKQEAEDDDSLTAKEQIKVNSYRKEMWTIAGTDELKEGYKKANEVLKQLKEGGLDSIKDKEVRKILEDYGFVA